MNIQLHDNNKHLEFAPLTLTRPVGDLRMGILTNAERWKLWLKDAVISFETEDYLADKFPSQSNAVNVNACMIPNNDVVEAIKKLKGNEELVVDGNWIAKIGTGDVIINFNGEKPLYINERWEIFQKNDVIIGIEGIDGDQNVLSNKDFEWIKKVVSVDGITTKKTKLSNVKKNVLGNFFSIFQGFFFDK